MLSDSDGFLFAGLNAGFLEDLDWGTVDGDSDGVNYMSYVIGLNGAEGAAGTHTLYVPKRDKDDAVRICPNATSLGQLTIDCAGGYDLGASSPGVSIVSYGGRNYWKIDGLTGTGGLSTTFARLAGTGEAMYLFIAISGCLVSAFGVVYFCKTRKKYTIHRHF
jgi:hypothetical protein